MAILNILIFSEGQSSVILVVFSVKSFSRNVACFINDLASLNAYVASHLSNQTAQTIKPFSLLELLEYPKLLFFKSRN